MDLTIFITGATSGFGAAAARRFTADGAKLILTGRRSDKLEAVKNELDSSRVHTAAFDIRDTTAYATAIRELPEAFAVVDVLVNNAGLALSRDPAYRTDYKDWETMIDTNVKGLLFGTHMLLPGMIERNRGHIINIGSVTGQFPSPGNAVYGATKVFVHRFSTNLRSDLLGTPIRVTEIVPGMVGNTEFSSTRYRGDQFKVDAFYAGTETLTADDIADAIHWAVTRPSHVNINSMQLMPVCQAFRSPGDTPTTDSIDLEAALITSQTEVQYNAPPIMK
ncbi:MAG: SDR family NAD(P)-dependent oxidoreductase [Gammaproteobacteria bacterium]|nr:SDR family NAD(P)-dependent oxidoreductase [Gammaproteobacteria bacterium]